MIRAMSAPIISSSFTSMSAIVSGDSSPTAASKRMIHYPRPLHLQPAYVTLGIPQGSLPHAERACERVLSLPLFPGLQIEQVEFVAAALRDIAGRK